MKNKEQLNKAKYHYIKIPNKIVEMGLNPLAISLYIYLCSFSEDFNPSLRRMTKDLGLARNTVYKYLNVLKSRNIIKEISPSSIEQHKSAEYAFVNPNEWISENSVDKV